MESRCALCRAAGPLCDSHIIPAFVARWLKETSATGFLRGIIQPNRRAQDFPTLRLLCAACERRFSVWEGKFAEVIFRPFHDGARLVFPYDEWLLKFSASLAWRCLATSDEDELAKYPQHVQPFVSAREALAVYLLNDNAKAPRYRHNLFFTPAGASSTHRLPEGLTWYLLRSADMTPVYSAGKMATFVKLPGMFFWTSLVPADPGGWKRTRIGRHGTFRAKHQYMGERGVGDFLNDRIETVFKKYHSQLSDKQKQRIDETVRKNADTIEQSKSYEAWLEDERISYENTLKTAPTIGRGTKGNR